MHSEFLGQLGKYISNSGVQQFYSVMDNLAADHRII